MVFYDFMVFRDFSCFHGAKILLECYNYSNIFIFFLCGLCVVCVRENVLIVQLTNVLFKTLESCQTKQIFLKKWRSWSLSINTAWGSCWLQPSWCSCCVWLVSCCWHSRTNSCCVYSDSCWSEPCQSSSASPAEPTWCFASHSWSLQWWSDVVWWLEQVQQLQSPLHPLLPRSWRWMTLLEKSLLAVEEELETGSPGQGWRSPPAGPSHQD